VRPKASWAGLICRTLRLVLHRRATGHFLNSFTANPRKEPYTWRSRMHHAGSCPISWHGIRCGNDICTTVSLMHCSVMTLSRPTVCRDTVSLDRQIIETCAIITRLNPGSSCCYSSIVPTMVLQLQAAAWCWWLYWSRQQLTHKHTNKPRHIGTYRQLL